MELCRTITRIRAPGAWWSAWMRHHPWSCSAPEGSRACSGRIARLIYNSRYGPVALPSEYKIHEGSIVFRTYQVTFTEQDLRTGIAHAEYQVVVEIDHVD